MKAALIYKKENKPNLYQKIFLKNYFESMKKEKKCVNISFFMYGLPVNKKMSGRMIERWITYLKSENITHVLLADDVEQEKILLEKIKENFQMILGNSIINHKFFDILRKCAAKKNLEMNQSTVVLVTDRPKVAEALIMKLYRHVKRIRVETKKQESFLPLINYFMNEYGLYISVEKEERKKDELVVMVDENKEKEGCDLDISLSAFYHNRVYFKINKKESSILSYVKLHQAALEFLMIEKYGSFLESAARRFTGEFNVRIIKIENID